ncbi:glycoside hydrolase [Cladochytrium replicatum]|nr:glycoside hydrolase [Cladochytrium replicatum]
MSDRESIFVLRRGYVSLFPLILGLVGVGAPQVGSGLEMIRFGIASLSQDDPLFGTGENYWRGALWININYLLLGALHEIHMVREGSYQQLALEIYAELRNNIIKRFTRKPVFCGRYSPGGGKGLRSHPFTGWTALVVLIMAEQYHHLALQ